MEDIEKNMEELFPKYIEEFFILKRVSKKIKYKGVSYYYFKILNKDKKEIDEFDYLDLNDVRIDMLRNTVRIYPKFGFNKVTYDSYRHKMYSIE